ncbi:hypothetical protein [Lentilactobacillus parakefiri]|uniref:Lipocalin-like domain-containing protein n=1 Tax=Lentilactobacillus parakefiri TaxID=152332 RepID=A0A269YI72_9LACO|nr:hypothetical protein [Lentilactobacillus parakefiri]PAK84336.1 hypothetical protein B8W98_05235 [Lentilactobacillus parakefiri]
MKLVKVIIAMSVACLFAIGYQASSANAATWHSGTPSALQGKWRQKTVIKDGGSQHVSYNRVSITKKSVETNSFGSMPDLFTHIKWRKAGHHIYVLHARRFIDGYQHKIHTLTIKQVSHNRMYMHLDGHTCFSSKHHLFDRY